MSGDTPSGAMEAANRRPDDPGLPGFLAVVAVLLVFVVVDPLVGAGGAVFVGACWVVVGPVPAFAAGQFVLVGLGPQHPMVAVALEAPLVVLLLSSLTAAAAPARHLAAGGVAFAAAGLAATAAWLWTDSVLVATSAGLTALVFSLYAVYRYGRVTLATPG